VGEVWGSTVKKCAVLATSKQQERKIIVQVSEGYEGSSAPFKMSFVKEGIYLYTVLDIQMELEFWACRENVQFCKTCSCLQSSFICIFIYTHLSIYPTTPIKTIIIIYRIFR
jgi:hypothetical protein